MIEQKKPNQEQIKVIEYKNDIYELTIRFFTYENEPPYIKFSALKTNTFSNFFYETKKMDFDKFKKAKLFTILDNISQVFDFLCKEINITIKEISKDENILTLLLTSNIKILNNNIVSEINLEKKNNSNTYFFEYLFRKINSLEDENKNLKQKIILSFEGVFPTFNDLSNILVDINELKLIENRLKKESNFVNKKMQLKLIFRLSKDKERPKDFHQICDNIPNNISLIKTKKNIKFGGYTQLPWMSSNADYLDDTSFCFSLTKKKIYDVIKGKSAIGDYNIHGPIFRNNIFYVGNQSLYKGSCAKNDQSNFSGEEIMYEINCGDPYFDVDEFEFYQILFV